MGVLGWIILSTFLISTISFIGIFALSMREKLLNKLLIILVALSAGALMGGAFLHLIPESVEAFGVDYVFIFVLVGFIFFFLVEKLLHWRHCHKGKCDVHSFAYMNLLGDAAHNIIDGLIIAASFVADFRLGIASVFAVALHEIPQEIGDFGVLIYGGFKRYQALFLNFIIGLTAVLGGIAGFFLASYTELAMAFLLPFAAGGFIYISASDLVPEIRKGVSELGLRKSMMNFGVFILGILMMYGLRFIA